MANALLDSTKVLRKLERGGSTFELCAEAIARHDRSGDTLTVELRAFLRAEDQTHLAETESPDWLPAPETVTEHVGHDEAHAVADDVFANWCRRVAASAPR